MKIVNFLVRYRKIKVFFILLKLLGIELPPDVQVGKGVIFPHLGGGIVIHPRCIIGDGVTIFQGVTVGRANPWKKSVTIRMGTIHIGENAYICAGAKILCAEKDLYVGKNTVIAANAVLTKSTGDNEIWGGIPAVKLKDI